MTNAHDPNPYESPREEDRISRERMPSRAATILVNTGLILQIHVVAAFHVVGIVMLLYVLVQAMVEPGRNRPGVVATDLVLTLLISVSLAALGGVYLLFLWLLRRFWFRVAMGYMVLVNVVHASAWLLFGNPFTAFRLAIPTLLYLVAAALPLVEWEGARPIPSPRDLEPTPAEGASEG